MVFLGDYLDPYTYFEDITHEQAYNNFIEILEFAKANPLRVILLYGNHDNFYTDKTRECCRHDYHNYNTISKLFNDHKHLFRYAYKQGNYLFTHAGVSDKWIKQFKLENINEDTIVDYINSNPESIWWVGSSRGGFGYSGPLWCCWEGEWPYVNNPFNLTQCIGHTMEGLENEPQKMGDKNVYMFDVQNCFLLDTETNEIKLLS